jgi:hypothetical protein
MSSGNGGVLAGWQNGQIFTHGTLAIQSGATFNWVGGEFRDMAISLERASSTNFATGTIGFDLGGSSRFS